jgi:hypothetical protein
MRSPSAYNKPPHRNSIGVCAKYAHHVDPILTLNVADFSRFAGIISVNPSSPWRSSTQSPPFAGAKDGAPGGRQTVEEFVRLEAAHDLNHLRQIDRILSGRM